MSSHPGANRASLAEREPDVEVLLAELKGDTVELYIDHPEGVTLDSVSASPTRSPSSSSATA